MHTLAQRMRSSAVLKPPPLPELSLVPRALLATVRLVTFDKDGPSNDEDGKTLLPDLDTSEFRYSQHTLSHSFPGAIVDILLLILFFIIMIIVIIIITIIIIISSSISLLLFPLITITITIITINHYYITIVTTIKLLPLITIHHHDHLLDSKPLSPGKPRRSDSETASSTVIKHGIPRKKTRTLRTTIMNDIIIYKHIETYI